MVMEQFSRKLLAEAGIHEARFALDWASAAQAPLYVELVTNFTRGVKELGPLGTSDGKSLEEIQARLAAAKAAASSVKLRTQLARLTLELRKEKGGSPDLIRSKMAEKLDEAIAREMGKQ